VYVAVSGAHVWPEAQEEGGRCGSC